MSTDNTITKTDLKNILEEIGNIGGSGDATPTPTANATAAFDSNAHMNSEDMTSSEIDSFVDGLDVSGINAVDYIVEQGTNYRKWNSGLAECWGSATIGSNSTCTANYPITLISIKSCVASCGYLSTGTYVAPTISVQPLATAVNFYARCSTSTVTNPHTVYWEIKGTWK